MGLLTDVTTRHNHQVDLLKRNPSKYLLCWDCGTGKTRSALELVEQNTYDVLIIVPKALVANWEREIKNWSNGKTAYHIITKETFRRDAQKLRSYDGVIVDEAHFFSGMSSQMSKSLDWYLKNHNVRYLYMLTATPYLSQPWNVYRLGHLLGVHWSYQHWSATFFYNVRMGGRMIPVLKPNMQTTLASYVRQLGIPVRMDEAVDLPDNNFVTEYFALTKQQEKQMSEAYDANPLTRFTREHQICGGTLKGDEFTDSKIFESDKRERVLDLAIEHDKLIVVCRYNLEIDALKDALTKAGRKVYVIRGETQDRDGVLQSARKEEKSVLIVNASCSEGWEYPEVSVMVFYSYDFSLKNYIQMLGRIQRINKIAKRTYLSLVVKSSIDEEVLNSLLKKESFHIEIYAKQRLT
jgi:superfamily II DNA or RNA helicase